ncbi:hypothetical protein P3T39_004928 [Kitasatospora sp. GP82]|nr:hypothetical protein [Kitasatospora sp. GP82]
MPSAPGPSAGSAMALLALVGVGALLHQAVLIPPLAASAALVLGGPDQRRLIARRL